MSSVFKNFLSMEPLSQRTAESWPPEEAVVASIRAAMKELQESVQDLCKTSLQKITTLCQCFYLLFFFFN